jgi:hypothetical protein
VHGPRDRSLLRPLVGFTEVDQDHVPLLQLRGGLRDVQVLDALLGLSNQVCGGLHYGCFLLAVRSPPLADRVW